MEADNPIDCIVAGEANVDLILTGVPPLEWSKEKTFENFELVLGGSSSITAFNLAALGNRVTFVGIVGHDSFGEFVTSRLASGSVDVSHLKCHKREKTGVTIWLSNLRQKRAGLTYPGTIPLLRGADIDTRLMARARHLHMGHYFLLKNFHKRASSVFRTAKAMGLTTSLDCNYDPTEQWDSNIRDVLRYTDVFFPNEDEARRLTGQKSALAAAQALGKLAGAVAVKRGEKGALVVNKGDIVQMPAKRVKVIDTTGAGDSFNAGYLSQLLKGGNTKQCLASGLAAAARCVTRVGGTAAFDRQ